MRVRIDLKIFLFLILFFFTKQIKIYGIMMLCAFLHEMGHLIAGIMLGMKPEKLEVIPVGFSISFKPCIDEINKKIGKGNMLDVKKIIVAFAGPFSNFILVLLFKIIEINYSKTNILIYANLLIMFFNLLPIYPLDGGRIVEELLILTIGRYRTNKYLFLMSITVCNISGIIYSILCFTKYNFVTAFIVIYIWKIILEENFRNIKRIKIYNKYMRIKKLKSYSKLEKIENLHTI